MAKPYRQIEYPARTSQGEVREEYAVYEYGEYEEWSVLAGQERRLFVDSFNSFELAKQHYPEAELDNGKAFTPGDVGPLYIPEDPPEWFDPMDAGEAWGEDDY